MLPFRTRDVFLTITNKGAVSLYIGKKTVSHITTDNNVIEKLLQINKNQSLESSVEFEKSSKTVKNESNYQLCLSALSDSIKVGSQETCYGIAMNPVNELEIAIFLSDGKIVFQNLKSRKLLNSLNSSNSKLRFALFLKYNKFYSSFSTVNALFPSNKDIIQVHLTKNFDLYYITTRLYQPLHSHPLCVSICPMMSDPENNTYVPLCVVGILFGDSF